VHEYDGRGLLVRSTTTTEPEWDDEARDAAFALLLYEANLCPGCRQPLAETTKPEHEFAYRAGQAIRCHRCTAIDRAHTKYESAPTPGALLIPVRLAQTVASQDGEHVGPVGAHPDHPGSEQP
jgi:hypothetical protein